MLNTILPFYVQSFNAPNQTKFPNSFPFSVFEDEELQMLRQKDSQELSTLFTKVYNEGSMLDISMTETVGSIYATIALDFLNRNILSFEQLDVIELGCGSGSILETLAQKGAQCTGLEPGIQIHDIANPHIIKIQDFFPSKELGQKKYDVLIHFFLLEHLAEPLQSLLDQKLNVKPGGKIILGVPNCEPFFANGDDSIFFHEHYNYFTRRNLYQLAKQSNLKIDNIAISENQSMILACFIQEPFQEDKQMLNTFPDFNYKWFIDESARLRDKVNDLIEEQGEENTIIYCPSRAMNTLFQINKTDCRLIDDNKNIHGKYLPALSNSIESFEQMIQRVPKLIINFSRTFSKEIESKCKGNIALEKTVYINCSDL